MAGDANGIYISRLNDLALVDDTIVKSITIVDIQHRLTHEGKVFYTSKIFPDIANNGFVYARLKTNSKYAHVAIRVIVEGKAYVKTYAGATYMNQGTETIPLNRRVNSSNVADTDLFINPTVSDFGIQRYEEMIGSGTNKSNQIAGKSDSDETIFPPNIDILISVQNVAGNTNDICIVIDFHESEI